MQFGIPNNCARCDKETERSSEDADERRSVKAQDLNPPEVPHVIRVPTSVRRSDRQLRLRADRWNKLIRVADTS